jgi:hypothetical protein
MKYTDEEIQEKIFEYSQKRNGKIWISVEGIDLILLDTRCPMTSKSNMVELRNARGNASSINSS